MKKKDLQDLRSKTIEQLQKQLAEKKTQSQLSYIKLKAGQESNLKAVKNLRREIAQILTIIRQKQIIEEQQENKETIE